MVKRAGEVNEGRQRKEGRKEGRNTKSSVSRILYARNKCALRYGVLAPARIIRYGGNSGTVPGTESRKGAGLRGTTHTYTSG